MIQKCQIFILVLFIGQSFCLFGQDNLIPNPSFESFYDCDYDLYAADIKTVIHDWTARSTSPRYFNLICTDDPLSDYYIDYSFCNPQDGNGYVATVLDPWINSNIYDHREYLQVNLLDTLHAGIPYLLSYYLTIPFDDETPLSHYGVYFSDEFVEEDVIPGIPFEAIILDAQIELDTIPDLSFGVWKKFIHCYIPTEDHTVMTVGVFEEAENILGLENITFSHTFVAYDNFFLAEIPDSLSLTIPNDTICVMSCFELSCNHSGFEPEISWVLPGSDILTSSDPTLTVCYDTPGTYDINVDVSHCGGSFTETFTNAITVLPAIDHSPISDFSACIEDLVAIELPSEFSVVWNDNSSLNTQYLDSAGQYHYSLSDGFCEFRDTFIFSYDIIPTLNYIEFFSCPNDSLLYDETYLTSVGTYYDTLHSNSGCDSIYNEILYTYFDDNLIYQNDNIICQGEQIEVTIEGDVESVIWEDDTIQNSRIFDSAESIGISITSQNGCLYSDTITISVLEPPTVVGNNLENIWYSNTLYLEPVYSASVVSYTWSHSQYLSCSDCPSPQIINPIDTYYTIEVKDINGCVASDTIKVTFAKAVLFVPNSVSTLGDEINSSFFLQSDVDMLYSLSIYDRWGNNVYSKSNCIANQIRDGWTPIQTEAGVYVYHIEYTENTIEKNLIGDVTVIK